MAASASARLAFILSLTDKVSGPINKIKTNMNDLADKTGENIRTMGLGLGGLVGAAAGISASLEPALEMNRALGDVRALGVAEDALTSLNAKALEFSTNYATNAAEFAASARTVNGAITGLVGTQLAAVTSASNLLAKATKSDAETTSHYLGSMYNLFKDQADSVGKVQWIEDLTGQTAMAVKLFRTDGAQLKDAFKEVGAIATTFGVSLSEQMAVIGTLSSTMEGGDAGGRYKAFFENLAASSEKTGIKLTDAAGKALPMVEILDKLSAKYGDLTGAAAGVKLTEAFGGEGAQVIAALAKDTDRLKNGLDQIGKVRGLESAEQMAKAMVDPWQQFGAAVQALRIAFGQTLIPMLSPLMERLVGIAKTLTRWTQIFPNITKLLGVLTLAVLGVIAALSAFTIINGIVGLLSLVVSPIALITIAVAALVAGVIFGILYWDRLKASFGNTAWFQALISILTPVVLALRIMGAVLNVLWVGLQQVWAAGVDVANWLFEAAGGADAVNSGWQTFLATLANLSPFALIGSALKGLIELLNMIPGISIDTSFGEMPAIPTVPGVEVPVVGSQPLMPEIAVPLVGTPDAGTKAEEARKKLAETNAISPAKANAVPQGGLLRQIQSTTNNQTNNNRGPLANTVNIHTDKPMTPLELENMMNMAVSG